MFGIVEGVFENTLLEELEAIEIQLQRIADTLGYMAKIQQDEPRKPFDYEK